MSNETSEIIQNIIVENNVEKKDLADSEILYFMLGLQTLDTAIRKIAEENNKRIEDLSQLKKDLLKKIFSKNNELGITSQETGDIRTSDLKTGSQIGPPTNLPMIEEGEVAHTVPHVEIKPTQAPVPKIITPTRPSGFAPPQHNRYPGSKDPYREPLQ